jgi:four helix bundle protein
VYKNAVYRLCEQGPLSTDWKRRRQLEEAAYGPPGHIAEGFGRFNPADFARFVVIARSSLMESPEALRNARRARERRIASRPDRRTLNPNKEPRTEPEHEPRSENGEE